MRRKLHYKDSLFLLFVGFLIAFSSFVDAGYLLFKKQNYDADSKRYSYKESAVIDVYDPHGARGELFEVENGNLMITSMTTMLTDQQTQYSVNVALSINEQPMYHITQGRFPDGAASEPVAVVGKSLQSAFVHKNGADYIVLEGDAYRVVGITGDAYSDFNDSMLIVFYDCLGEHLKQSLEAQTMFELRLDSNLCDAYEEALDLYQMVTEKDSQVQCAVSYLDSEPAQDSLDQSRYVVDLLLFLFCLINCIMVSIYWMTKRLHEIIVRRMYGYSTARLAFLLWREIVSTILACGAITAFVHIVYEWATVHRVLLNQYYLIRGSLLLILFTAMVSIITIAYPIYYIRHVPMAKAVYREG